MDEVKKRGAERKKTNVEGRKRIFLFIFCPGKVAPKSPKRSSWVSR